MAEQRLPSPPEARSPSEIKNVLSYYAHAALVIILGAFYLLSPRSWYGPSWSYFYQQGLWILPAGGIGLGGCLAGIGLFQLLSIRRDCARCLITLFFCSGFAFTMAGALLGAEGLMGHRGLQEAPLLLVLGMFKFIMMSIMQADRRSRRANTKP